MYPDYTIGPIPSSWTDASWHHDACPSLWVPIDEDNGLRLRVFTDAADPNHRDCGPDVDRFTVVLHREGEEPYSVFGSNAWSEVLDFVAGFERGHARSGSHNLIGWAKIGHTFGCREEEETTARGIESEAERSRA